MRGNFIFVNPTYNLLLPKKNRPGLLSLFSPCGRQLWSRISLFDLLLTESRREKSAILKFYTWGCKKKNQQNSFKSKLTISSNRKTSETSLPSFQQIPYTHLRFFPTFCLYKIIFIAHVAVTLPNYQKENCDSCRILSPFVFPQHCL